MLAMIGWRMNIRPKANENGPAADFWWIGAAAFHAYTLFVIVADMRGTERIFAWGSP
jgi:hypothetical protein